VPQCSTLRNTDGKIDAWRKIRFASAHKNTEAAGRLLKHALQAEMNERMGVGYGANPHNSLLASLIRLKSARLSFTLIDCFVK
jgi:plasmid stability protein